MNSYLQSYKNQFWRWDMDTVAAEHIAINIHGEFTLVYKNQLLEVLDTLKYTGLPPLSALLHVLLVINERLEDDLFNHHLRWIKKTTQNILTDQESDNCVKVLSILNSLPKALRTGDNKTALIQKLFEQTYNQKSKTESQDIFDKAADDLGHMIDHIDHDLELTESVLKNDLRPIALMIRKFKNLSDLINLLSNDQVDPLTLQSMEELDPYEKNGDKSIVDQLIEDKTTFRIGSLVKRIWSGLKIPMTLNNPGTQPMGGISDITNKGSFHSLLTSEFVYDEDVFISRILNNESLYIERESPPDDGNKNRVLLIDQSIKNWGVPKTLSHAVAVAIAAHPKTEFSAQAYIVGVNCEPFNIFDIAQVIATQSLLSGQLNAFNGIKNYFEEYHQPGDEVFLFTQKDTHISSYLQSTEMSVDYLITTDTSGQIEIERLLSRNSKSLKKLFIPYQELWSQAQPKRNYNTVLKNQNLTNSTINDLLLEPLKKSEMRTFQFQEDIFIIQDGHLFSYGKNKKALDLIAAKVVRYNNSLFTFGLDKDLNVEMFEFNAFAKAYIVTNLKTLKTITFNLKTPTVGPPPKKIFMLANKPYLLWENDFYTLNKENVSRVSSIKELIHTSKAVSAQQLKLKQVFAENKFNYNVFVNIESISFKCSGNIVHVELGDRVLVGDTIRMKESVNTYLMNEEITNTSPIVDLYIKKINENQLGSLCNYLDMDKKKAAEHASNLPSVIKEDVSLSYAKELKSKLEEDGLTCFYNTKSFRLPNGNEVKIEGCKLCFFNNSTGENFVMTSIIHNRVAFASEKHVSGNRHFIPENDQRKGIDMDDFKKKYLLDFLNI